MRITGGTLGLVVGGALLLLTACVEEPPIIADPTPSSTPSESEPTTSETSTPATGVPVVALVDAGRQPRRPLRFSVRDGDTQILTMRQQGSNQPTINGRPLPVPESLPVTARVSVDIADVTGSGAFTAAFTFDEFRAEGDSDRAQEINENLELLRDVEGTMRITARGEILSGGLRLPPDLPKPVAASWQRLGEQLQSIAVPFPQVPVGVGATWTVTAQTTVDAVRAEVVRRFELLRFTPNGVELGMSMQYTAPQQPVDLPSLPASVNVLLDSMELRGTGHYVFAWDKPLPLESEMSASGSSHITGWDSQETVVIVQDIEMQSSVKSP